jgi:REP element-mobilizing transposase RayT
VLKNRSCHLYRIGGVEDHLHILFSLHPTQALLNIVKEIKTASSAWIKGQKIFPHFTFWQEGYGAFTVAAEDRPALIAYIQNQEQHHATISFTDELQQIVEKLQLTWHADHLP